VKEAAYVLVGDGHNGHLQGIRLKTRNTKNRYMSIIKGQKVWELNVKLKHSHMELLLCLDASSQVL
jgi:hypothetical protein